MIINVPKLKTHVLTGITCCVKNLFGCLPGDFKGRCHKKASTAERFSKLIVDVYQGILPQLNIVDAVVSMEGEGPSAGSLKKTGLLLFGRNGVAVDVFAANILGFKTVLTNEEAISRNLSKDIEVVGEKVDVYYDKQPRNKSSFYKEKLAILFYLLLPENSISVNKKSCTRCKRCMQHCPVSAIKMNPYPVLDRRRCIRCFCCIEICPQHAFHLQEPLLKRFLLLLKEILSKLLRINN